MVSHLNTGQMMPLNNLLPTGWGTLHWRRYPAFFYCEYGIFSSLKSMSLTVFP